MGNSTKPENKARICTNFPLNMGCMGDTAAVSEILKHWGVTPYVYVCHSLRMLVGENYNEALKLVESPASFDGKYYPTGSQKNEDFIQTINFMRYLVLHLTDSHQRYRF